MVDVFDGLKVLLQTDFKHYRCCDYITAQMCLAKQAEEERYSDLVLMDASMEVASQQQEQVGSEIGRPGHDDDHRGSNQRCKSYTTDNDDAEVPTSSVAKVTQAEDSSSTAAAAALVSASSSSRIFPKQQEEQHGSHEHRRLQQCSPIKRIHPMWREKMCTWAYGVIDNFDMDREIVAIALSYIDRYLSKTTSLVDRDAFSLLFMTCLYMAIKLNECNYIAVPGSVSTMHAVLLFSRGRFTLGQMQRMEIDVLRKLGWFMHPPTPHVFAAHILHIMGSSQIYDVTRYVIELAVLDYFFVPFSSSEIALGAILNAGECFNSELGEMIDDMHCLNVLGLTASHPNVLTCRHRLSLILQGASIPEEMQPSAHYPDSPEQKDATVDDRQPSPVNVVIRSPDGEAGPTA